MSAGGRFKLHVLYNKSTNFKIDAVNFDGM